MAKLIVAVTGTPGTGKSVFARELARGLPSSRVIEINDIVDKRRLYTGRDRFGSRIVDIKRLSRALEAEVKRTREDTVIIVGHLVPDLEVRPGITVVLRLGLAALAARLEKRGYPKGKIRENIISEAVDYCGVNAQRICRKTYEVESKEERKKVASYIAGTSRRIKAREPPKKEKEKLHELLGLIKTAKRYGF